MEVNFEELRHSCDFSGWATKNDYPCSDGRTIKKNAFIKDHGKKVPLVWNHQHNDPENVLGHAYLENRDEGVYSYGFFNDTEMGKNAKEYVKHGDITALSIWANQLRQNRGDVLHGCIRELSLVLAGANPGAYIDNPIAHDGSDETSEAIIKFVMYEDVPKYNDGLSHSDTEDESDEEEVTEEETEPETEESQEEETETETETEIEESEETISHADKTDDENEETIAGIYNGFSDKEKDVVNWMIAAAVDEALAEKNKKDKKETKGDDDEMSHSVFTANAINNVEDILKHSAEEITDVFESAKANRARSLKEEFLSHGITEIGELFPDYKVLDTPPAFIKRPDGWVPKVMGGVKHSPFSRIKSRFADITGDEARARGYVKGNLKVEEQFGLLGRTTDPQTVYKKQKLDRDDVIDITDFDVVAWLKLEMRQMLEEELARAILIGDGRASNSPDKIKEDHIRPIWTDDPTLFTINTMIEVGDDDTANTRADKFIDAEVRSHVDYTGSGSPDMYVEQNIYADMLLQKDKNGRRIYTSKSELATALLVNDIVPVPVMKNKTRTVTVGTGNNAVTTTRTLLAIIVNLMDYTVGADKGGAVSLFDDFDIDYNAQKYLIETRMSGALTTPFSAIIMESIPASE